MEDQDRTARLIAAVMAAPPDRHAAILSAATADPGNTPCDSLRLLRPGEFAHRSGLSRCSVWRMCKEGRLRTVEIRKGSRRIPESELVRLVEGRK